MGTKSLSSPGASGAGDVHAAMEMLIGDDDELAAALWDTVRRLQSEVHETSREQLRGLFDAAMRLHRVDPVPHATVAKMRRRAELQARLLADSGALDIATLVELRGGSRNAVDSWLSRAVARDVLLRVTDPADRVWVPTLVLDLTGARPQTRDEMAEVLGPLRRAGLSDWAAWTWLTTRSSADGDDSPAELLARNDVDALAAAARRLAARSSDGDASAAAA